MLDIITIFDTCVDMIVDLGSTEPEFNQKEKYVDGYSVELGGSACIFACQTAKLGLKTGGVGIVGDDLYGQLVREKLSGAGVDIGCLSVSSRINTGLGLILTKRNDRSILTYSGTIGAVSPETVTDDLLRGARHLHIASYYLLSGLKEKMADIVLRAKGLGLTVSLDTNWDPEETWELPGEVCKHVDIFLPNENEILLLTGTQNLDQAAACYGEIPIVAVKRGAQGASLYTGGKVFSIPAVTTTVVDTVGAGDSFDGGFLFGYLNGYSAENCLKTAAFCGSMNTRAYGGIRAQAVLSELSAYFETGETVTNK